MATKTKMIEGLQFEVNQPYAPGHVLTEAEARALNQTRSENIGNNARKKVKEMIEAGNSPEEIVAYVNELDSKYEFTLASVGASRKLDPVEREARSIARELLKEHLAKDGRKLTVAPEGYTKESWDEKIEAEIDRISASEQVLKQAKKNIDAKRKTADTLMEAVGGVSV